MADRELSELEKESLEIEALLPNGGSIATASISDLNIAMILWRHDNPKIMGLYIRQWGMCFRGGIEITPKKRPPIRQWSEQSKQRNRLKKLQSRLSKKYSLPILYQDALQEEIRKNPWYFGMCQIFGDKCFCPNYKIELAQKKAIARENELRARGE